MATTHIVNPDILKRCRIQIGIDSIEESIKITGCDRLAQYESGDASPTINQLERIADSYSVPSWVFFREELPAEYDFSGAKYPEFRTLGNKKGNLSYKLKKIICTFRAFRENLIDILEEDDGVIPEAFHGPSASGSSAHILANETKKWLGYSEKELPKTASRTKVLAYWKKLIEDKGILIFTTSSYVHWSKVPVESMRGLAIYDKTFPIIILNGSDALSANLFTLMHELGHILLKQTNLIKDDYLWSGNISNDEKFCNEFAAEILMPNAKFMDLAKDYKSQGLDPYEIASNLSKCFAVSVLAVAIKMKMGKELSDANFDVIKTQLESEHADFAGIVKRNRPSEIVNFYGKTYTSAIFRLYYNEEITLNKLINALSIKKLSYIPSIESIV